MLACTSAWLASSAMAAYGLAWLNTTLHESQPCFGPRFTWMAVLTIRQVVTVGACGRRAGDHASWFMHKPACALMFKPSPHAQRERDTNTHTHTRHTPLGLAVWLLVACVCTSSARSWLISLHTSVCTFIFITALAPGPNCNVVGRVRTPRASAMWNQHEKTPS